MKLRNFTIKDIIFTAVLAAALTLSSLVTMLLVMSHTLFGIRNMASAMIYPIFAMLGIMKIKKIGVVSLMGFFHSCVLLFMAPVMFWAISFGGFLSEMITYIVFRNYDTDKAKIFGATLFIPMTLPTTLIFSMWIHGKNFREIVEKPYLSIGVCVLTVLISFISAKIGQKIGRELQKAGKL